MTRSRVSAGLLMYRLRPGRFEVFVAHPGGPFLRRRDEGCWSIPKGEVEPGEDLFETAKREFEEEVGLKPTGEFIQLGSITQKGGKTVHAWAFEGDWKEGQPPVCNTFTCEWPPGSGRLQEFPEIDRVAFLPVAEAKAKLKESQHPLVDRLDEELRRRGLII